MAQKQLRPELLEAGLGLRKLLTQFGDAGLLLALLLLLRLREPRASGLCQPLHLRFGGS
jgi:hypothetical protein